MIEALGGFAAIGTMALATYSCRIAGFLLMRRVRMNPTLERALRALPGAIVASTVVPVALHSGPPAIAAVVVAIAVTRLTRHEIAGLACGLASAAAWRALI